MLTLGIEPGTAILGYGLVESEPDPILADYGAIETRSDDLMPSRLARIFDEVGRLIAEWHPEVMAVEKLFFARNVSTAIAVGQARGVALLAAARAGITVAEYTPTEVKQAVTGYGAATKDQVQRMVQSLLALPRLPRPPDAADALALALCHLAVAPRLRRLERTVR